MTKKLFITGISGFIGRHVAAEALRRGYSVRGLDRKESTLDGVEFIEADIRDRGALLHGVKDADYTIQLAAVTSNVEFMRNAGESYDINTNGFLNVMDVAANSGCEKVVYASSAAVYGDIFSEDAIIDMRTHGNHYANTKLINEVIARSYQDIYKMKTTGLRYFNVYGNGENDKGDYSSIVAIFLRAQGRNESLTVYGDGKQARDLIYVTDAARMTVDLLEKGENDIYNIGTGVATAYTTIAEMIDKTKIVYVPNPLATYQYYTRADTTRVRGILGEYEWKKLEDGIEMMRA
jgi:nucleoside-diphosphate-sugar epimerase